mgnify:CR=1 FL=1
MNLKNTNSNEVVENIIKTIVGVLVFAIGIVNMFAGDDAVFGVFILLLSTLYFPATSVFLDRLIKDMAGHSIPRVVKIILFILILWAAMGVGELFDKIELLIMSS